MRPLTLFVPAALVAALTLAGACGGASTQDVLGPEQDATASSSGASGASSGSSGASSGSSGSTSGSSGTPDASVVDSSAACPQETEPNNGKDAANTLAPTLCGVINPNSESDFLTFVLKPTSTSMQLNFTGQVVLKVDVNGQSVTLDGTANVKVPFVKDKRYSVEVKATDKGVVPWRVDLVEK